MEPAEQQGGRKESMFPREYAEFLANGYLGVHGSLFGPDSYDVLGKKLTDEKEAILEEARKNPNLLDDFIWQLRWNSSSNWGRVIAEVQFDPEHAQGTYDFVRRQVEFAGNSNAAGIGFSVSALSLDSDLKTEYFLKDLENSRQALSKLSAKFLEKPQAESASIKDPELISDASHAFAAAILYGYSLPAAAMDEWLAVNIFHTAHGMTADHFLKNRMKLLAMIEQAGARLSEYKEKDLDKSFVDLEFFKTPLGMKRLMEEDPTGTKALDTAGDVLKKLSDNRQQQQSDPLNLTYAILQGFLVGKMRFEDATRLYRTMANTS